MGRRIKPFRAEMDITTTASDGWGLARHEGQVIFVEKGVPGDKALVHVYRKRKKQAIGKIEELLAPSEDRREPQCSHFGTCGGCKWQMMTYESQLREKQQQVYDAFERIAKVEIEDRRPIMGCEDDFFYRNKLEFTFSNKAWLTKEMIASEEEIDQRALGFHVPRIYDKIINLDACHLQLPIINDIRNATGDFCRKQNWDFYNIQDNTGWLRNLMFRTSKATGELMVVLIVKKEDQEKVDQLFRHLEERFPQITSFIYIINPKDNSSFSDQPYHSWKGPGFITEQLGDFRFKISPTSFFQTNPAQANRLYDVVKQYAIASLPEGESQFGSIYDLYSGTGSIGIYLSDLAQKIVGVEYVQSSIDDAWKNVELNGLTKFSFYAGDMKKVLSEELIQKEGSPDLIITDPARAGMDPKVVDRLLDMSPKHIVYVSCKPATQARDIALMKEQYEVLSIQPVDMFPQTAHVENVAWLRRRDVLR